MHKDDRGINMQGSLIDPDFILGLLIIFPVVGAIIGIVVFNNNGHEVNEYTHIGYVFFALFFSMIGLIIWGFLLYILLYIENSRENNYINKLHDMINNNDVQISDKEK